MDFRKDIARNKTLSGVLVFGFVLLLALIGYAFGFIIGSAALGLAIALTISIVYALIGWFAGSNMALSSVGAIEVHENERDRERKQLYDIVDEVRLAAGVPMPRVWVIPSHALNAFATGTRPEKAHVAATQGLLERLNREETKGVIAHEIGHIRNYDVRLMLLASVLAGAIIMIAEIGFRSALFSGGRRNNNGGSTQAIMFVAGLVFSIFAVILAQLAKMALSRQREYLADATSAELTRYPEGLASALEKIGRDTGQIKGASSLTSEMFIKNPIRGSALNNLFSTHPPITDRIKRLRAR